MEKQMKRRPGTTKGRTYEEIYGDKAEEIRRKHSTGMLGKLKGRPSPLRGRKQPKLAGENSSSKRPDVADKIRTKLLSLYKLGTTKMGFQKGHKPWNAKYTDSDSSLYGDQWNETRRKVLERDGWKCSVCGSSGNLNIHHIFRVSSSDGYLDNRLEWLVTLCDSCHTWAESRYNRGSRESEILLFSGGIDTTIAYYYLNQPPIMFQIFGHRYMLPEFIRVCKFAKKNNSKLHLIQTTNLGQFESEDAWIPGRNLLLVATAALFADKIYLVAQRGEQSEPDRSPEFFSRVSILLTELMKREIVVDCVFPDMTKQDIVGMYLQQGYPLQELLDAHSCFSPGSTHCGKCAACFRRAVSLEYNGIDTSNLFDANPFEWDGVHGYVQRLQEGKYEQRRAEQTIEVLKSKNILE